MTGPRAKFTMRETALLLLRVAIGWHFLYEGCWKLMQEDGWSCASYLGAAQGPLAPLFKWMAEQGWIVATGNWAVQLGLVAIGLALIAFRRSLPLTVLAIVLIVAPHVVGAPQPASYDTPIPEGLHHQFVVAVTLTNLVFWVVLGAVVGVVRGRFTGQASSLRDSFA